MSLPAALSCCKVYTPAPLAAAIVEALGHGSDLRWLDPCVGEGAFVAALAAAKVERAQITALDLDTNVGAEDTNARTIRGVDFLGWASKTGQRFHRIIANPPYVSVGRLPSPLLETALRVREAAGVRVTPGSNCWLAFLVASLPLLRKHGHLTFVLPSSWDYADYALSLRETLPTLFRRFEIHRCRKPMFPGVQEGTVVILGFGFQEDHKTTVRFDHHSFKGLCESLPKRKTPNVLCADVPLPNSSLDLRTPIKLGDLVKIRLGAVTGDARFFVLTEAQRKAHRLPTSSVVKVLSKARHLVGSVMSQESWSDLLMHGERLWLFSPSAKNVEHSEISDINLCLPVTSPVSVSNSLKNRGRSALSTT